MLEELTTGVEGDTTGARGVHDKSRGGLTYQLSCTRKEEFGSSAGARKKSRLAMERREGCMRDCLVWQDWYKRKRRGTTRFRGGEAYQLCCMIREKLGSLAGDADFAISLEVRYDLRYCLC